MPLVAVARRRRCAAFTPVVPRATKACDIRPTRPPSRRSSRSCGSPAMVCSVVGFADCLLCCGAPACASTKRSRCASRTSIAAAARCSSVAAREGDGGRSGWTIGDGRSLTRGSSRVSRCRSVGCFASSTDGPADGRGAPAGRAPSCDAQPLEPAFADASLRISCATLTRWRWPRAADRGERDAGGARERRLSTRAGRCERCSRLLLALERSSLPSQCGRSLGTTRGSAARHPMPLAGSAASRQKQRRRLVGAARLLTTR